MTMSNELVVKAQSQGLAALMMNLDSAASRLLDDTGTTSGAYFQFSGKNGNFTFNGQPLDVGTTLAFNMMEMRKGIVCWFDSKPIHRDVVAVLSNDPKPALPAIEDRERGHQWNDLIEVDTRIIETGEKATLSLSSRGGVTALTRLFSDFATKARMNVDAAGNPLIPLVEIGADKKSGKDDDDKPFFYYIPKFKITGWISKEELAGFSSDEIAEGGDDAQDDQPEPAPAPAPAPAVTQARPAARPGVRR
jgi:hypothetical protein